MEMLKRPKLRLMIADNSASHLQMLEGYIKISDSTIELCGSFLKGEDLLKALKSGVEIDLIVAEYYLLDMDAPFLFKRINELGLEKCPVVLFAVEGQSSQIRLELLSLGAEYCIIKPYHLNQLLSQIRSACGIADQKWEHYIYDTLKSCGLTEVRKAAFGYVFHAVGYILQSGRAPSLAKEIYRCVAKRDTVSESAVETALRRAATQVFELGREDYFAMCSRSSKPTDHVLPNGAFLEVLVQEVYRRGAEAKT